MVRYEENGEWARYSAAYWIEEDDGSRKKRWRSESYRLIEEFRRTGLGTYRSRTEDAFVLFPSIVVHGGEVHISARKLKYYDNYPVPNHTWVPLRNADDHSDGKLDGILDDYEDGVNGNPTPHPRVIYVNGKRLIAREKNRGVACLAEGCQSTEDESCDAPDAEFVCYGNWHEPDELLVAQRRIGLRERYVTKADLAPLKQGPLKVGSRGESSEEKWPKEVRGGLSFDRVWSELLDNGYIDEEGRILERFTLLANENRFRIDQDIWNYPNVTREQVEDSDRRRRINKARELTRFRLKAQLYYILRWKNRVWYVDSVVPFETEDMPTYSKLAVDPASGRMALVYGTGENVDQNSPDAEPIYVMVRDPGQEWQPAVEIGRGYLPDIAVVGGEFQLVYFQPGADGTGVGDVLMIRSANGVEWTDPEQVNVDPATSISTGDLGQESFLRNVPNIVPLGDDESLVVWAKEPHPERNAEKPGIMFRRMNNLGSDSKVITNVAVDRTINGMALMWLRVTDENNQQRKYNGVLVSEKGFATIAQNGEAIVMISPTEIHPNLKWTMAGPAHGFGGDGIFWLDNQLDRLHHAVFEIETSFKENYARSQKLLDDLYKTREELLAEGKLKKDADPSEHPWGVQLEYIANTDTLGDERDSDFLADREWIYTQGIMLAQVSRKGTIGDEVGDEKDSDPGMIDQYNDKARRMAQWMVDHGVHDVCPSKTDTCQSEPGTFGGWRFSEHLDPKEFRDPRLVAGANSWALNGFADFLVSSAIKEMPDDRRQYFIDFFVDAYRDLLFRKDPDNPTLPHLESWMRSDGLIKAGWTINDVFTEAARDVDQYYTILQTCGYAEATEYEDCGIRTAAGENRRPARNVVTEHNLDVLAGLNDAILYADELELDASFQVELVEARDRLQEGLFTKLYNERGIVDDNEFGRSEIFTRLNAQAGIEDDGESGGLNLLGEIDKSLLGRIISNFPSIVVGGEGTLDLLRINPNHFSAELKEKYPGIEERFHKLVDDLWIYLQTQAVIDGTGRVQPKFWEMRTSEGLHLEALGEGFDNMGPMIMSEMVKAGTRELLADLEERGYITLEAANEQTRHDLTMRLTYVQALPAEEDFVLDDKFMPHAHKIWSILNKAKDRGRVITGLLEGASPGIEDDTQSPFSAIDNSSWLALSVNYDHMPVEHMEKLADGLDFTIDTFVRELEVDKKIYLGSVYFPNEFSDPYIAVSLFQELIYHMEATCGVILGLAVYADAVLSGKYPQFAHLEQEAKRFRMVADALWYDMNRFVADKGLVSPGLPYATERVLDLHSRANSATAAVWFIDTYDYYAEKNHATGTYSAQQSYARYEDGELVGGTMTLGLYNVVEKNGVITVLDTLRTTVETYPDGRQHVTTLDRNVITDDYDLMIHQEEGPDGPLWTREVRSGLINGEPNSVDAITTDQHGRQTAVQRIRDGITLEESVIANQYYESGQLKESVKRGFSGEHTLQETTRYDEYGSGTPNFVEIRLDEETILQGTPTGGVDRRVFWQDEDGKTQGRWMTPEEIELSDSFLVATKASEKFASSRYDSSGIVDGRLEVRYLHTQHNGSTAITYAKFEEPSKYDVRDVTAATWEPSSGNLLTTGKYLSIENTVHTTVTAGPSLSAQQAEHYNRIIAAALPPGGLTQVSYGLTPDGEMAVMGGDGDGGMIQMILAPAYLIMEENSPREIYQIQRLDGDKPEIFEINIHRDSGNLLPTAHAFTGDEFPFEVNYSDKRQLSELDQTFKALEKTFWPVNGWTQEGTEYGLLTTALTGLTTAAIVLALASNPVGWAVAAIGAAVVVSAVVTGWLTGVEISNTGGLSLESSLLVAFGGIGLPSLVAGRIAMITGTVSLRMQRFLQAGIFAGRNFDKASRLANTTRTLLTSFAARYGHMVKGQLGKLASGVKPTTKVHLAPAGPRPPAGFATKVSTVDIRKVIEPMTPAVQKAFRVVKAVNRLSATKLIFERSFVGKAVKQPVLLPPSRNRAIARLIAEPVQTGGLTGLLDGTAETVAVALDPEENASFDELGAAFGRGFGRGFVLGAAAFGAGTSLRVLFKGLPRATEVSGMVRTLNNSLKLTIGITGSVFVGAGIATTEEEQVTFGRVAKELSYLSRIMAPWTNFAEDPELAGSWAFHPVFDFAGFEVNVGNLAIFAGAFAGVLTGSIAAIPGRPTLGFTGNFWNAVKNGANVSRDRAFAVFFGAKTPTVAPRQAMMDYLRQLGRMAVLHLQLELMGRFFGEHFEVIGNPFYFDMGRFIFGHFGGHFYQDASGQWAWEANTIGESIQQGIISTLMMGTLFHFTMPVFMPAIQNLPLGIGWYVKGIENLVLPTGSKSPWIYEDRIHLFSQKALRPAIEEGLIEQLVGGSLYHPLYLLSGRNEGVARQLAEYVAEFSPGPGRGSGGSGKIATVIADNLSKWSDQLLGGTMQIDAIALNQTIPEYRDEDYLGLNLADANALERINTLPYDATITVGDPTGVTHTMSKGELEQLLEIKDRWGELTQQIVLPAAVITNLGLPAHLKGARLADFTPADIERLSQDDRATLFAYVHTEIENFVLDNLEDVMKGRYNSEKNQIDISSNTPLGSLERLTQEYANRILAASNAGVAAERFPGTPRVNAKELVYIREELVRNQPGAIQTINPEEGEAEEIPGAARRVEEALDLLAKEMSDEEWDAFLAQYAKLRFVAKDLKYDGASQVAFWRQEGGVPGDVYAVRENLESGQASSRAIVYMTLAFFQSLNKYQLAQLFLHEVNHGVGFDHTHMNVLERRFNEPKA